MLKNNLRYLFLFSILLLAGIFIVSSQAFALVSIKYGWVALDTNKQPVLQGNSYALANGSARPITYITDGKTVKAVSKDSVIYLSNTKPGTAQALVIGDRIPGYKDAFITTFKVASQSTKAAQNIVARNINVKYGSSNVKISVNRTPDGGGKLKYSTSNAAVATVNSSGEVKFKKVGKAQITITAEETASYAKATKTITVTVAKADPNISAKATSWTTDVIYPNLKTYSGKMDVTSNSGGEITYKVTAANKNLSFSNGTVSLKKGSKAGTYKMKVLATSAAIGNYTAGSKEFTVSFKAVYAGAGYPNGYKFHQRQGNGYNCGATAFLVGSNILLSNHGKGTLSVGNVAIWEQMGSDTRCNLEGKGDYWYKSHGYGNVLKAYRGINGNGNDASIKTANQLKAELEKGHCVVLCTNNKARWKNSNGWQPVGAHPSGHYIVFYYYDAKNKKFYANDSSRPYDKGAGACYSAKKGTYGANSSEISQWLGSRGTNPFNLTTIILSYTGK